MKIIIRKKSLSTKKNKSQNKTSLNVILYVDNGYCVLRTTQSHFRLSSSVSIQMNIWYLRGYPSSCINSHRAIKVYFQAWMILLGNFVEGILWEGGTQTERSHTIDVSVRERDIEKGLNNYMWTDEKNANKHYSIVLGGCLTLRYKSYAFICN